MDRGIFSIRRPVPSWLATGAGPEAVIDTIEGDPAHFSMAREHLRSLGLPATVNVHFGSSTDILPMLPPPYDLVFLDGLPATYLHDLHQVERLLRVGGLLVASNLFLGRYEPGAPWLATAGAVRKRLIDDDRWRTVFLPNGKALSVWSPQE